MLLSFLALLAWRQSIAQQLKPKQEEYIRKVITSQFGEMSKTVPLQLGKANFCIVNNDTLFNPDGFHYLFKLNGDSAERLDQSVWHGANFDSYLFEWQGSLCNLGGYGMFSTNNNLEYFNLHLKEWSFKPTEGPGPSFIRGIAFKTGHFVYSLNNVKGGNSVVPNIKDTFLYRLDLRTMSWEKSRFADTAARIAGTTFYLENFCFQKGNLHSLLVNPATKSYVIIKNEEAGFVATTQITSIDRDKMLRRSLTTSSVGEVYDTLDMAELWKKNSAQARVFELLPKQESANIPYKNYAFLAGGFIITLAGSLYWLRRRKKQVPEIMDDLPLNNPEQSDLFNTICAHPKTVLNTEELDELLAIGHLELDSRKLRRHRLLSALEKDHPGLIVREKDKNDKRRFIYRINKDCLAVSIA